MYLQVSRLQINSRKRIVIQLVVHDISSMPNLIICLNYSLPRNFAMFIRTVKLLLIVSCQFEAVKFQKLEETNGTRMLSGSSFDN